MLVRHKSESCVYKCGHNIKVAFPICFAEIQRCIKIYPHILLLRSDKTDPHTYIDSCCQVISKFFRCNRLHYASVDAQNSSVILRLRHGYTRRDIQTNGYYGQSNHSIHFDTP